MIKIYCDQFDFNALAAAFDGETESDITLSAEIILTDEEQIQKLNLKTRGIDSITDVLSYPALENIKGKPLKKADFPADIDDEDNLFLGSIAICEKRAREQAEEYGHPFMREINYLATHGLFHLLGYDHMTEEDRSEMREREERVLAKIKDLLV